ncbi:MAG TPA: shikimate dehydrogenase [Candidatus Saccharimonadales bacterium]|nr:shikimate dehydrogenase [Candidatus Saccharimonadales bacterium]
MNYSALIGNPTDHSVSYVLYKELAKTADLPSFYQHIRVNVEPDELKQSLKAFNTLRFVGLNVTLPYKLDVISYLDKLDTVVEDLGAVNTIKLGKANIGYNTDWMGIVESIKQFGDRQTYPSAVIFGTGGAARAAVYACKQLGVHDIHIVHRAATSANTQKLQESSSKLGVTLHPYSEVRKLVEQSQLIINATSAGMVGKEALPFDTALLEGAPLEGKVFLDAVFNPLRTPLLEYFEANGAITIDGLWMMIYQGVGALGIWFDRNLQINIHDLQKIHDLMQKELQHV